MWGWRKVNELKLVMYGYGLGEEDRFRKEYLIDKGEWVMKVKVGGGGEGM